LHELIWAISQDDPAVAEPGPIDIQRRLRIFVIPAQAGIHNRLRFDWIRDAGAYGLPPTRE